MHHNGKAQCETPCEVALPRNGDAYLVLKKEGYKSTQVKVESILSWYLLGNIITPGRFNPANRTNIERVNLPLITLL